MVYLTIKEVKKQLHIHVKFDSFDELPVQLAQRLAPYTVNRGLSAFFYLPALSDAQALSFLRLCRQLKLTLLGIDPLPPEAPLIRAQRRAFVCEGSAAAVWLYPFQCAGARGRFAQRLR